MATTILEHHPTTTGKRRRVSRDWDAYTLGDGDVNDDDDDEPFLGWVPRGVLAQRRKRLRPARSVRVPCRLIDAVQCERAQREAARTSRPSPWDRLPGELLDALLNGPHGVAAASRASARLVCRRWRDVISTPSATDERRLATGAPDGLSDCCAWARGRCVAASTLAAWARAGACPPSLDVALGRARLACASATGADVAAAIALSGRRDAVAVAVSMVGGPMHFVSPDDCVGDDYGDYYDDGAAVPDRASLYAPRPYTVMSTCHALAERVASAAGARGLGAAAVAVALARGGSLPSVLGCIEAAVARDRAETALALAGVAIARRYAQRWAPGHAVDDIVRRVWEATARHGAVRTARLLGSALNRWTVRADVDVSRPRRDHRDNNDERWNASADGAAQTGTHDNNGDKDGGYRDNDDCLNAQRILGDWAWDLVATWARAPAADWFCAVAARGHVALLDISRRYGWTYDGPTTAMSALCSGRIDVCATLARWHAEDNDGEFGPLPCEPAVRLLLYAVGRGRCLEADLARGLAWLAAAAPAADAPIGAIGEALAPWPSSPYATLIVDIWPGAVVRSDHLRGALAAYIQAGRWADADRLVSVAVALAVGGSHSSSSDRPPCPCFALWEPWVARLAESVAYDRPDQDGGTAAVEALVTLCALALRAGALDAAAAPPAARRILEGGAFLCITHCADPRLTATWADAVRVAPLPLSVALSVRSLTVDDPRDAIRGRAASLVRWLATGGLCADLCGHDGTDDGVTGA
ncbi:hypothetical protein pdul_cds_71 [Pandoravirus dulcis]|uniref:F-box domain containing protein n=1 Tax=Pandoravirus dulcis TaxID=1349409 RepID=S4VV71_9VIRU|nr:hypothetical protein pdul_cds_71 [Pandoravirus dulcis]AGO81961.1 hypothetical protein pdul_cds_71 [Pandoravirus dulcis]